MEQTFRENFLNNGEVGASFAVVHEGKLVVDLWGGYSDATICEPNLSKRIIITLDASELYFFYI